MQDLFSQNCIPDIDGEEWKEIEGYNKKYFISNYSRVKSFKHHKVIIMKQEKNNKGYARISLSKNGKSQHYLIHRLVAKYFVFNDDPKVKDTVDHIDGNKENNKYNNLQWLSLSDNIKNYWIKRNTSLENNIRND